MTPQMSVENFFLICKTPLESEIKGETAEEENEIQMPEFSAENFFAVCPPQKSEIKVETAEDQYEIMKTYYENALL